MGVLRTLVALLSVCLLLGGCSSWEDANDDDVSSDDDATADDDDATADDDDATADDDDATGDDDDSAASADLDGDGWSVADGDCDDNDASVHPEAPEQCDGVDNNCDGTVDEGVDDDLDGDGVTPCDGDCDDTNADTYPGAAEVCDGEDNDCDGSLPPEETDQDGDGWSLCDGDCDENDPAMGPGDGDGDGVSPCDGDCDDTDADTYPGAVEICDGVDNDCNGAVPGNEADGDADGVSECDGDCDDTDADTYPGAAELCDGIDNTCEGIVDEGFPPDQDGDGYSECEGDCDDGDSGVHPGAVEVCNGSDDDCDGVLPWTEQDNDGDGDPACSDCDDADASLDSLDLDYDGYSTCDGDCDDGNASFNPASLDLVGDGVDQNCDGLDGVDADGDGYANPASGGDDCDDGDPSLNLDDADADGYTTCDGDCFDFDAAVYPGAFEVVGDGMDNDCDGAVDETDQCDCPSTTDEAEAADICYGLLSLTTGGPSQQMNTVTDYGSSVYPRAGCEMLGIHTGIMFENPAQYGADTGTTTVEWDFTGVGVDCNNPPPAGNDVKNNLAWALMQLEVPPNTHSFSVDFLFVSTEYIEWVCTEYNDTFELYLESSALDPATYPDHDGDAIPEGNVAFDGNGKPITVNSNFFVVNDCSTMWYVTGFSGAGFDNVPGFSQVPCTGPSGNTNDAGATGWLTTTAPVTPGEIITLKFSIWDEGDGIYDSAVFIDNFQWLPTVVTDPETN